MKLGIFLNNLEIDKLDYSNPLEFNPGIAGTIFQLILFIKLIKQEETNIELTIFSPILSNLKSDNNIIVREEEMVFETKSFSELDIYLTTSITNINLSKIHNKKVKFIFWAHNYLFSNQLEDIISSKLVFRIVFCGKQFYDRYIDHNISIYSTYIFNMIPYYKAKAKNFTIPNFNITYIGAIIPSKGFLIVAKSWKKIIKKIPNAKLNVIGSGALYNRSIKLGKYSLAEEKFEKKIIKQLKKADSNLSSIKFWGVLGEKEKRNIISNTSVGIMNPSARTETFGISSIDFQQQNIPVVIRMKNGLLDTFLPGKTGLGYKHSFCLSNKIIKLYSNPVLRSKLGSSSDLFVNNNFEAKLIFKRWINLLTDFQNNQLPLYEKPTNFYFNNFKWIRIIIRWIRFNLGVQLFPPLINIETLIYKIYMKSRKL